MFAGTRAIGSHDTIIFARTTGSAQIEASEIHTPFYFQFSSKSSTWALRLLLSVSNLCSGASGAS